MEADKVVPDVISAVPTEVLQVTYPNGEVNLGNEFTPTQVKDQPQVSWQSNNSEYYTLIMVDPDAPCRMAPILRDVNHWLIVNILGNDITTGEIIAEYRGSGPPKLTGLHRYIFLVYKQSGKLEFKETYAEKDDVKPRIRFSLEKFITKYNLGQPIAGNFFKAQYDSSKDEAKE